MADIERLTKWEGISTYGKPAAVLVQNEKIWNENMTAALRKVAEYEGKEEQDSKIFTGGEIQNETLYRSR